MNTFRLALWVEYDGAFYYGWQFQPHLPTISGELYRALIHLLGETLPGVAPNDINTGLDITRYPYPIAIADNATLLPSDLIAAGRTDRGVHGRLQVVHIDLPLRFANRPADSWARGMNTLLPHSIKVLASHQVSNDFSARKSAISRHYRYFLLNRPVRPAILAGKVGFSWRVLDINAMQAATNYLVGTHDFTSFRDQECQAKTPIRTMQTVTITYSETLLCFHFQANAFLHHMIRNIMGALIEVGCGKEKPEWIAHLLALKDRTQSAMTFMPDGLYLWQIDYPENLIAKVWQDKINRIAYPLLR